MVEINLLPWREYRHAYQVKRLKQILVSTITIALIFVCILHFLLMNLLQRETTRLSIIQAELQRFSTWKTDEDLIRDSNRIDKQASQHIAQTNKLFQMLASKWQENVCFTELVQDKNTVLFTGYAETTEEFTEFIKHWNVSHLFTALNIESLQYQENAHAVQFHFRAFENTSFKVD